jgi:hypothetical protein
MPDWLTDVFTAVLSGAKMPRDTLQDVLGLLGGDTRIPQPGSSGGALDWSSLLAALSKGGGSAQTLLSELLRKLGASQSGVDMSSLMSLFSGEGSSAGGPLATATPKNITQSLFTPEELQASQNIADLLKKEAENAIGGLDPEVYSIGRAMYGPAFDRAVQAIQQGPDLGPWEKALAFFAAGLTGDPNSALMPIAARRQEYQKGWEMIQEAYKARQELERRKVEQFSKAFEILERLARMRREAAEAERREEEFKVELGKKRAEAEKAEVEAARLKAGYQQFKDLLEDIRRRKDEFVKSVIVDTTEVKEGKLVRVVRVDQNALDQVSKSYAEQMAPIFGLPEKTVENFVKREIGIAAHAELMNRQQQPLKPIGRGIDQQGKLFVLFQHPTMGVVAAKVEEVQARVPGGEGTIPKEAYVDAVVGDEPDRITEWVFSQQDRAKVPHPENPKEMCELRKDKNVAYVDCGGRLLSAAEYKRLVERRLRNEAERKYYGERYPELRRIGSGGGKSGFNPNLSNTERK